MGLSIQDISPAKVAKQMDADLTVSEGKITAIPGTFFEYHRDKYKSGQDWEETRICKLTNAIESVRGGKRVLRDGRTLEFIDSVLIKPGILKGGKLEN